ncbi:hypothetical protein ABQE48_16540 [Mycolicibacterium thermoresistibile]
MVTHDITIPEVENTQVRGRDTREASDTSPRKPSKALTAALKKRRMMVLAGAGDDALAVIDARIARLGGRVTPITDAVESPAERFARLTTERVEMVEMKRRRVEALRAELAAAEADLEETVQRYITTPLIEDAEQPAVSSSPVEDDAPAEQPAAEDTNPFAGLAERAAAERAERETADRRAGAVLGDQFAAYEPAHVLEVARGARPRWVRGDDGAWYVAARADQVMEGRWVEVERVDGSVSVELLSEAFAVTEVGGVAVAVCSVVPDVIGEVSSGSTNWS